MKGNDVKERKIEFIEAFPVWLEKLKILPIDLSKKNLSDLLSLCHAIYYKTFAKVLNNRFNQNTLPLTSSRITISARRRNFFFFSITSTCLQNLILSFNLLKSSKRCFLSFYAGSRPSQRRSSSNHVEKPVTRTKKKDFSTGRQILTSRYSPNHRDLMSRRESHGLVK